MDKKQWFTYVLIPLLTTWFIDRFTKMAALEYITQVKFFGYLGFVKHFNHGAMLGLFSDLPPLLRVVSLSTGGAFLILIFVAIQYITPTKSFFLRCGLSILLGGILGNVADRIVWGYVVDFIIIGNRTTNSPAFNMADALQWVGYGFIVAGLIKDGKYIWPEDNLRKSLFVNVSFQLKYCWKLVLLGLGFALIASVYSYTYLRVTIIDLVGHQVLIEDRFLIPYLITFGIVCAAFIVFLFFIGLVISHRLAGPVYAIERYLEDILEGNVRRFKLRTGDEFIHFEEVTERFTEYMREVLPEKVKDEPLPDKPSEITEDSKPT